MDSVVIIKPNNNQVLTQFSPNPILKTISIKQIEVNQKERCWNVVFEGKKEGSPEFWDQLANQLVANISEIDQVKFIWDEPKDDYMESLMKNFKGPQPNSTQEPPSTNGQPKRSRSRRRKIDREINESPVKISEIYEEQNGIVITGEVTAFNERLTRSGKTLVILDLYDQTDSITCKLFLDDPNDLPKIKIGDYLKVKGDVQFQAFDRELSVMIQQINQVSTPIPSVTDNAPIKRVEFHLHTKMSGLDGTLNVEDAVKQAAEWGHSAIAITDHGVVQAFPQAHFAGQKHGVKIIYGVEGYLIDNDNDRPYHIIILAKNQTGLKNLYKLISYSHLHHFYRRPRITRELLNEHRSGLILGSACEQGEVYQAFLRSDQNVAEIAQYYDYLEIQPLGNNEFLIGTEYVKSFADLEKINRQIYSLGKDLNIPVIATGDVHFLRPNDALYRAILLMGQGFEDAEHQAPLYYRTTEEMLAEFTYLGADGAEEVVITQPNALANEIEALIPVPKGLHSPEIPEAENKLKKLCYETATNLYGNPLPDIVEQRLEKELTAIISNGFAALYWTAHQLVKKSNEDGYMVGSRGSVGSSLAATMSGITEVNPLPPHYLCPECHFSQFFEDGAVGSGIDLPKKECPKCGTQLNKDGFDIPFEVFLGFYGDKVPDIDLNFSGEYQATIQKYTEELFGSDKVFRAGTVGTLANKTAYGFVMKYLEQVNQTKRSAEVNRMLQKIVGVKRTTGQHPGGMIVVPEHMEIYDFTPVQHPANDKKSGVVTTHFEYSYIEESLVKLDNLGHDGPTMMKIFEELGDFKVLDIPFDDPETMKVFNSLDSLGVTEEQIGTCIGTLGVPEFGTPFVRQMMEEIRPTTFADLVAIMGLSHGTDVWLNNAQELIKQRITDFKEVIACRDDIMVYLINKGLESGDAFKIMEQVRKGRGLTDEDVQLMKKSNVPQWYIDSCFKIKYMFPKAHAVAYAFTAYRAAYYKVYFPEIFYATFLSLKIDDVNGQIIIEGEQAVREELAAIAAKGNEATAKENNVVTVLEVVLEALARGVKFAPVDLYKSDPKRVLLQDGHLLLPLASLNGLGVNAAANIAAAREEGEFLSIEDLRKRSKVTKTVIEALSIHNCLEGMSETNQLSLF